MATPSGAQSGCVGRNLRNDCNKPGVCPFYFYYFIYQIMPNEKASAKPKMEKVSAYNNPDSEKMIRQKDTSDQKDISDKLKDSLNPTLNFFQKDFVPAFNFTLHGFVDLFFKFLKVHLISIVLSMIFALVSFLAVPFVVFSIFNLSGMISYPIILAYVSIVIFLFLWFMQASSKISYVIVDEKHKGQYSGIWPILMRIAFPMFKYFVFNLLLFVIAILIPAIMLYVFRNNEIAFLLVLFLTFFYLFILAIFYLFFTQFWLWELLIEKKGVIQSLKDSFSLACRNAVGLIIFDLFLLIVFGMMWVIFYFINTFFSLIFYIPMFLSMLVNIWIYFGMLLVMMVFLMIIRIIEFSITDIIILPIIYSYWKAIKQTKPLE
jgi:hypothetical protein